MSNSYERLYAAFQKRYNDTCEKKKIQEKCNVFWRALKNTHKNPVDLDKAAEEKIHKLLEEATRTSATFLNFFVKVNKHPAEKNTKNAASPCTDQGVGSVSVSTSPVLSDRIVRGSGSHKPPSPLDIDDKNSKKVKENISTSYPKPRQEVLEKEIKVKETELNCLITKRDVGLTSDINEEKNIKQVRRDLERAKKLLRDKKKRADWQKSYRIKQRQSIHDLLRENPEASKSIKVRDEEGRPRLEEDQSGLLKAICDIAMHSGSADDRRRSEAIRACKTLDHLYDELQTMGFKLSKSALYLRFLPRSSSSTEGKRHVVTVPVKLCRAQSDYHKEHADQYFCKATINALEEVASILGPGQVWIISQDDKAKIPLGMTAAKAQAPILMHLEYKIRLADHDWMVASRHKLTPSVYAGITIKENCMGKKEAVTHSGPTYVALRSGKHSSSTASTHGGPDENPRYRKVILHAISTFKKHDLDAVFIFTNAPGRSAFNRVERRMAPMSREMSGVVLPHDHFGSHLDASGKTIDDELELKNFQYAGEVAADILSKVCIDKFNVTAEYISSMEEVPDPVSCTDHNWYANHVRESQYFLQIVKCDDKNCCLPMRSKLNHIIYQRFLPGPYPLDQQSLEVPSPSDCKKPTIFPSFLLRQTLTVRPAYSKLKEIPYDLYCPSLQEEIDKRVCSYCGLYFASKVSMDCHRKNMHSNQSASCSVSRVRTLQALRQRPGELLCKLSNTDTEWIDIESIEEMESLQLPEKKVDLCPIITTDVSSWMAEGAPFTEDK